MAEAFCKLYGGGVVEAFSSGSNPSGGVNPKAIESMRAIGYDLSAHRPKSLSEIPDVEYDYAVTMGCGEECPVIRAKRRIEWDIPDPKAMRMEEFNEVRDLIGKKVSELLSSM